MDLDQIRLEYSSCPHLACCAGMTHVENLLSQNCNIIFSQFQVYFKYISQAKRVVNLFFLDNFYPVVYRRVRKESDESLYTVLVARCGPQAVNRELLI